MATRVIDKLVRYCKRWGGELILIDSKDAYVDFDKLFVDGRRRKPYFLRAPSSSWHGLCWSRKQIYAVKEKAHPGAIIHEMGHVFADRYRPTDRRVYETNWLGWEICLARVVGCYAEWSDQNGGYGLGDLGEDLPGDAWGGEWGALDEPVEKMIIDRAISRSKKLGLIDQFNRPLAIR